jgi:hypothetical protein
MPPAPTFAKLCTSSKIAVPPKAQHAAFLSDAGISTAGATVKDIHERCAALAWARASLASATDPDSWSTTLDASLHPTLLGLYALPPHRGSDAPPSDFQRLASTIKLYDPADPAQAPAPPPAPPSAASDGSTVIDTTRPSVPTTPGSSPPTGGAPASPSAARAQPPDTPPTQKKRARMLMHVDLAAQLPPEVYLALDAAAGMEPEKRAKFHKA